MSFPEVDGMEVAILPGLARVAVLRAEYYEYVDDPAGFVAKLRATGVKANLFSFIQHVADRTPRYPFHQEWDRIAVLPITTYEHWLKKQINDKTRNMIRKAQKNNVELRIVEFNDDFVRGIEEIYNETPLRQGKPFAHYGKAFETLKKAHMTFLERSQFIGAYWNEELIGFVKLVFGKDVANLMQIITKVAHRDKAATNALIARSVEICATKGIPRLHYGVWSRRGLGDFKKHHAFEPMDVPRYYIPLNPWGGWILRLGCHRRLGDRLPGSWVDYLTDLRAKWYLRKYSGSRA